MSRSYFNTLNYTLANEDTSLELGIIPDSVPHLMSVAGSGSRVLPLLAKSPGRLTCVDLSKEQLYLTELRIESLRAFDLKDFMAFWGYAPHSAEPKQRRKLFSQIQLRPQAKEYFEWLFAQHHWGSILYIGKWEQMIGKLSQVNRWITGQRGLGLFSNLTQAEQDHYLKSQFPTLAWNLTLRLLGQAAVFNVLLYKGHSPKKNIPEKNIDFYSSAFKRAFSLSPARENFLLQLLFFGKILFAEGNPVECNPEVYQQAKQGLNNSKIQYRCENIIDACENSPLPVDAVSFSDVPSYFSGTTEKEFLRRMRKGLSDQAIVVIRNYMRVPENTDTSGFERVTHQYENLIQKEKIQLFKVDVFKNLSSRQQACA